jgi:hypothetical protein
LRDRITSLFLSTVTAAGLLLGVTPAPTHAAGLKVVIIVGPTGDLTAQYKEYANREARVAVAAGAEVVKVYSPRATWSRVRRAAEGANVIIFHGHGNGFPNPYTTQRLPDGSSCTRYTFDERCELRDRVNGFGLNQTRDGGNGEKHMVYCGEKALLGELTTQDGALQWRYCGGATGKPGINPARNFAMIYANACYAPGEGEPGTDTGLKRARARVASYSRAMLKLGAGGYFASDVGASGLLNLLLTQRDLNYRQIYKRGGGYDAEARRISSHPDVAGAKVWVQRTDDTWMGKGYWYAFAGFTTRTPAGR